MRRRLAERAKEAREQADKQPLNKEKQRAADTFEAEVSDFGEMSRKALETELARARHNEKVLKERAKTNQVTRLIKPDKPDTFEEGKNLPLWWANMITWCNMSGINKESRLDFFWRSLHRNVISEIGDKPGTLRDLKEMIEKHYVQILIGPITGQ